MTSIAEVEATTIRLDVGPSASRKSCAFNDLWLNLVGPSNTRCTIRKRKAKFLRGIPSHIGSPRVCASAPYIPRSAAPRMSQNHDIANPMQRPLYRQHLHRRSTPFGVTVLIRKMAHSVSQTFGAFPPLKKNDSRWPHSLHRYQSRRSSTLKKLLFWKSLISE
jgi:hypothetical protein